MGRQFLDNGRGGDMYFPFFTFLQFLFYMGWLKVRIAPLMKQLAYILLNEIENHWLDSGLLYEELSS